VGLDNVRVVFSDLFDTLILRTVAPENTKRLAAKRLAAALDGALDAEQIYQVRARLEREACAATEAAGGDLEFRFDDAFMGRLHAELAARSPAVRAMSIAQLTTLCHEVELDAELRVQTLDEGVLQFLREAKERGLPVYAVSDFYFPETLLARLLERHGVAHLFDRLFVSSEHRVTKRSGRLYDLALGSVGVAPSEILMIGDNEHSDVKVAGDKGLRTHHIDRAAQRALYEEAKRLEEPRSVEVLIRQAVYARGGATLESFFPEFPLTLFAFIDKLYLALRRDGVRDALFLSREGEFLKRLFDRYQDIHHLGPRSRIRTHYLLASRCSTFIASLAPIEEETFETLFRQYRALSLRDFLSNLNFEAADVAALAAELGIDPDRREADFPTSAIFAVVKATPHFRARYEEIRTEQRALFKRYVAGMVPDGERAGIALVDVGWKGTIQDHIHRIYDGRVAIDGYYLGLVSAGAAGPTNRKRGVLFSLLDGGTPFWTVYNDNRAVFEILLGASHGSASRYVDDGAGGVRVATLDLPEEQAIYRELIAPLQRGFEEVFVHLAELFSRVHFTMHHFDELVARTHARFSFLPTDTEMDFFSRLHHFENFGAFGTSRFDIHPDVPLRARLRNLVALARAPRSTLERGWWPALTLEQLGLGPLRPVMGWLRLQRTFGPGGLAR